ncbi:proton myo-inositol cotransporter [Hyalella azteca]|uniref:Proton myo-inositol cotransporter n=1 Tax=Hyalella azteca TaxID=294128 RepID=A0A979FII0_HYAAZ|nr:proton myo-inositol cotransporter [Hyalella azteca]
MSSMGDFKNLEETSSSSGQLTRPMLILTLFSAIGGFLFGYDTGVVSGAMLLVRHDFNLSTAWHEIIVSGTIAAAWVAALAAGPATDRFGRRRMIVLASVLFVTAAVVMGAAPEKITLLCGRIIAGLAIGFASMCVPLYLSEMAETTLRGRLTVTNIIFVTGGQFAASLVCGAFSNVPHGWRCVHGCLDWVPAAVQFVGFFFMPESPRWLVAQKRNEEAKDVLLRFRPPATDISAELRDIVHTISKEMDEEEGVSLGRILATSAVRRALTLGCLLQMFQQLAGINTVMYYSASIITMAGIGDPTTAIWISAGVASCNFVFTFVGLALVERIGRRPLLLWSLAGMVLCLLELGVSFNLAYVNSPTIDATGNSTDACTQYTSCSTCTTSSDCGFCFSALDPSYLNASCLAADHDQFNEVSISEACSNTNLPEDVTFAYDWCPYEYGWLSILGLACYLLCFAPGMGPMPWTINSELYPGWARARCVGITSSVNWAFNLLVSLTFLTLTEAITKHGTFYLYACVAAVGLLVFYWSLPETRGMTLENIHVLFNRPLFSSQPYRTNRDSES